MTKRLTNEEFLERLCNKNPNIEPLEEYQKSTVKIHVRCHVCGYKWYTSPNKLLTRGTCPKCSRAAGNAKQSQTRRKTHEQFVKEAVEKNEKVDVIGQYVDAKHKVEVKCKRCGKTWEMFPGNILHGGGCRECSSKDHRVPKDEVMARIKERNPAVVMLTDYTLLSDIATFHCNACGTTWSTTVASVANVTGCPQCGIAKMSKARTKTHEQYVKDVAEKNPNIEILGTYKGSSEHIEARCKICGHRWSTGAGHLIKDTGCPKCAGNIKREHEEFLKLMQETRPDIEVLGTYKNTSSHVKVKCTKCGWTWNAVAGGLIAGSGCPICAGVYKKSHEQFLEELGKFNDTITPLDEYVGANEPIRFKCNRCGETWKTSPSNVLKSTGCPKCNTTHRSFFEHVILFALRGIYGTKNVKSRDRRTIGMELDVYVPELKLAFEPGAWYYHKERLEADEAKRAACEDAGITLYTIYFGCNEPELASKWCMVYENVLSAGDWNAAKAAAIEILSRAGISCDDVDWENVRKSAALFCGRRNTEDFIEEVAAVNDTVEVLGEYTGANNRIKVKCKECGKTWEPLADSLLHGHRCKQCSAKAAGMRARKSKEDFIAEAAANNPYLDILSEYDGIDNSVTVQCRACGKTWDMRAYSVLKGNGCPRCNNASYRRTHEEFLEDLEKRNPSVVILSEYTGNTEPIEAQCKACGNKWTTQPGYLLSGRGCPKCGRKKCDEARHKTHEKFVAQLAERNPNVEAVGEYKYAREKMEFRCKKCGETWYATPDNILRGRGCPKCRRRGRQKAA